MGVRTYMAWLFAQRGRDDPIGDLARDAFRDPKWDGSQSYLRGATDGQISEDAYIDSVMEYREWSLKDKTRTKIASKRMKKETDAN